MRATYMHEHNTKTYPEPDTSSLQLSRKKHDKTAMLCVKDRKSMLANLHSRKKVCGAQTMCWQAQKISLLNRNFSTKSVIYICKKQSKMM